MIAIRGATTASANEREAVLAATRELLQEIMRANQLRRESLVSMFFTATADIDCVFPAEAARQLGYNDVPLLGAQELSVRGSLPLCIRVMIHADLHVPRPQVRHIYLGGAASLRPDLVKANA